MDVANEQGSMSKLFAASNISTSFGLELSQSYCAEFGGY